MSTQAAFIAKVTAALGNLGRPSDRRQALFHPTRPDSIGKSLRRIPARTSTEQLELLSQLIEQGKPLNLRVITKKNTADTATAIAELVGKKSPEWGGPKFVVAWQHPLIEALDLAPLLAARQVTYSAKVPRTEGAVAEKRATTLHRLATAFVGITSPDYCLAETATLVLKTRPACARAVSLLPTIHVAVIELRQVIENLAELFARLKSDSKEPISELGNCLTLITGPSKTADIELTMVHGAHGPRELYLYVIAPEAFE